MARPLTRAQTLENRAFLKMLARTGNIREAVRETGLKKGTMFYRRAQHPAFAQAWDAAVAVADARLAKRGGRTGPAGEDLRTGPTPSPSPKGEGSFRTAGGEPVVVRRRDGKLQVRRAQPGKVTTQCEQAFLAALSATANVTLAAAAVGVAEAAFYRRKRNNPGFAREMRLAIALAYERLELALLESTMPESHADDAWRHNEPPPIPPMTPGQALQLMYLHHKTAKLWDVLPHARKLPHETTDELSKRVHAIWRAKQRLAQEDDAVAAASEPANAPRSPFEPPPPALPDLAQVTGWSKASGNAPHHAGRALFGGWRIADMEGKGDRR